MHDSVIAVLQTSGLIDPSIHITGGSRPTSDGRDSSQTAAQPSSRVAITYGRPKWDRIFASIAAAHPRQHVGVFVCGPKVGLG